MSEIADKWPEQWESQLARVLFDWRDGYIDDIQALAKLQNTNNISPGVDFAAAQVEAERGNITRGQSLLRGLSKWNDLERSFLLSTWEKARYSEPTFSLLHSFGERVSAVTLSDNVAICGDRQGKIRFIAMGGEGDDSTFVTQCGSIRHLISHPNQDIFALSGDRSVIEVWSLEKRACISRTSLKGVDSVGLTFTADGNALFVVASDGTALLLNGPNFDQPMALPFPNEGTRPFTAVAMPHSKRIIALCADMHLIIWEGGQYETIRYHLLKDYFSSIEIRDGLPQLAAHPTKESVLVSDGYKTQMICIDSFERTRTFMRSGVVAAHSGETGFCCGHDAFSLIDFAQDRILRTFDPTSLASCLSGSPLGFDENSIATPAISASGRDIVFSCLTTRPSTSAMGEKNGRKKLEMPIESGFDGDC